VATQPQVNEAAPLTGLVPMIRVADVERSAAFYRLLGFEIGNKVPRTGSPHWAWLYAPKVDNWKHGPNLMVVRGESEIKPDSELVLFYLYATNLPELRNRLIAEGVNVSEISYPEYLPQGEFRTQDPDGYCLMVAQAGQNTP
jgi:catechol 2,3-dioxygenase-like lactoylglutathione lyase family enzyme